MSCKERRELLDDYLDDRLAPSERTEMRSHLASCLPCRRELKRAEQLRDRVRAMDPEVAPRRDLWPGVVARIGGLDGQEANVVSRSRSLRRWWAHPGLAAAAALLMTAVLSIWWVGRPDGPLPVQGNSSAQLASLVETRARADAARAEDGVLLTRSDLMRELEWRRADLPEAALIAVEDGMEELDRSIVEIRAALEINPDDLHLHRRLAGQYRMEVEMLQRVTRI